MKATQIKLIYSTLPNIEIASMIAKKIVEERLTACVNLINKVESFYMWEDVLQQNTEVILLAKTTNLLVQNLIARLTEMHPYECPAILSIDIKDGNRDFFNWVQDQTT